MPKKRHFQLVQGDHFSWRLTCRHGTWYADGRSNQVDAGRHSLGTRDKKEALELVNELDTQRAVDIGLILRPTIQSPAKTFLTLDKGRTLYEQHVSRPRVAGGVKPSSQKRYRAVFDKFIPFAKSLGIVTWNTVDADVLTKYAADMESKDYCHKTLVTELITLKQSIKWMIEAGHLTGIEPIKLHLLKAESERPHCWSSDEVAAIIEYCVQNQNLRWLTNVVVGLACTGLRISELASLRWADINLEKKLLTLTDETAHAARAGIGRRQVKSGRSRSFPIHPDLQMMLSHLPRKDGYLFHGPRGGRIKPDTVRNILIRDVLTPLSDRFPTPPDEKGFHHGRLHSFRHYFCSTCANAGVPEQMLMGWLGHLDSGMVRHYYHIHDGEARRRMESLNLLGGAGKRFTGTDNRTACQKTGESPDRESPDKPVA